MRTSLFLLPFALVTAFSASALEAGTCRQVAAREAELRSLLQSWHIDFLSTMTGESFPVLVPPTSVIEDKVVFEDEQVFRVGAMLTADHLHAQITQLLNGDLLRTNREYARVSARLAVAQNDDVAEALRLSRERMQLAAREECRGQASQR